MTVAGAARHVEGYRGLTNRDELGLREWAAEHGEEFRVRVDLRGVLLRDQLVDECVRVRVPQMRQFDHGLGAAVVR